MLNTTPPSHDTMPAPKQRPSRVITLSVLYNLLADVIARQTRIETRLVKLMHEHGLDADGNPLQG